MLSNLQFKRVSIETTMLAAQRQFYAVTLGFKLASETRESFIIEAGSTQLQFKVSNLPSPPLYHFAFNIPENQIHEALACVKKRIGVMSQSSGYEIFDFTHWNAHAFYFLDPEGNIGEFIARHNQPNATEIPFDLNQVQCVSEWGIVTEDVANTSKFLINCLGLACYPNADAEPGDDL